MLKSNMFQYPKEPRIASTTTEEFSFPVISNPLSSFMVSSSSASSSSLWRISSRVYHHQEDEDGEEEGEEEEGRRLEVRSMCEEILPSRREVESGSFNGEELEMEESMMDYLWENFNNEEEKVKEGKIAKEICVVKGNNKVGRRPSSSMLVIGKLLKGLVSIRKSAQLKILKARF